MASPPEAQHRRGQVIGVSDISDMHQFHVSATSRPTFRTRYGQNTNSYVLSVQTSDGLSVRKQDDYRIQDNSIELEKCTIQSCTINILINAQGNYQDLQ